MGDLKRRTTPKRCYRREQVIRGGKLTIREYYTRPGVPEWEYSLPPNWDLFVNPDQEATHLDPLVRLRPHQYDGDNRDHLDRRTRLEGDLQRVREATRLGAGEKVAIVKIADRQDWIYDAIRKRIGGQITLEE